jgi:CBS domain-containing protein
MKLKEAFTRNVVTAEPEDTLAAVATRMQEQHVGTVVIVEGQRPVGIITDRDLALALGAQGISRDTAAHKVMTRHVVAIPEDTGLFAATKYIKDCAVRRLPIVDSQDHVVGVVSMDDMFRLLARELYNLAEGIEHEMKVK